MKKPQFLIRFDDICPTMNWGIWEKIEAVLYDTGVKPIVAVVPDNKDPALSVGPARASFWKSVRAWQERGWGIAIHGYQHVYVTNDGGMLRLNERSEFASLPDDEQGEKLVRGLELFRREGINPTMWVAPAHSFDGVTVRLLRELGIRVISDGLFQFPHEDAGGTLWIPQQLWRFRKVPRGIWTVCYHHNSWTEEQLCRFQADIRRFRKQIVTSSEVCAQYAGRQKSVSDRVVAAAMFGLIRSMGYYGRLQTLRTR